MSLLQLPLLGAAPAGAAGDAFVVWLRALPPGPPADIAGEIARRVQGFGSIVSLTARLALLELARDAAQPHLAGIENALDRARPPFPASIPDLQLAGNDLLKALGAAYAGIMDGIARRWLALRLAQPLRLAAQRAAECQERRLLLSHRARARLSRSAWRELHRIYGTARGAGCAHEVPAGAGESVEQIYRRALLLAFADPNGLKNGELDRLRFYLARHAHLARVVQSAGAAAGAVFLIADEPDRPGRAAGGRPVPAGALMLDCTPLTETLKHQLDGLLAGVEPVKLGLPRAARQANYQELLTRLLLRWSAQPARRFPRQRPRPRAQLVVGFDALWTFLAGPAFRRRFEDGRPARHGRAQPISEWSIADESAGGFALQYLSGDASGLEVGEILGVRACEASTVQVGVARRLLCGERARLKLGMQKLAPSASAATLPGSAAGRRDLKLILLGNLPHRHPGPAVAARPGTVTAGSHLRLPRGGSETVFRVGPLLQTCASCELFALFPDPL